MSRCIALLVAFLTLMTFSLRADADTPCTTAPPAADPVVDGQPDLIADLHVSQVQSTTAGPTVTVTDETCNVGVGQAAASTTRFYLLPANTLDVAQAIQTWSRSIPTLGPLAKLSGSTVVTLPRAGSFQIVAQADADNTVVEGGEGNNLDLSRVLLVGPDLVVEVSVKVSGNTISITDRTRNRSQDNSAVGPSTTKFYLSTDTAFDEGDIPFGGRSIPALDAQQSDLGVTSMTLPVDLAAGTYRVIAVADGDKAHPESDETKNVAVSSALTFVADLMISSVTVPKKGLAGEAIAVTDTTTNLGVVRAPGSATGYYLSRDRVLDGGDVLLGTRAVPVLDAGANNVDTITVGIPSTTPPGCYYVIASADVAHAVAESRETNSARARPIQIRPTTNAKLLCANSDFNGDRKSDILWRHQPSGDVGVWLMDGGSLSSAAVVASVSADWTIVARGDFSGDGKADILWRQASSGALGIWLMDGASLSSSLTVPGPPLDWIVVAVDDFDGDGTADILWRHLPSGDVGIWLMDGTSLSSGIVVGNAPPDWSLARTGDFDGDGRADLLWRHQPSGDIGIWLMDGASLSSSVAMFGPPPDWTIAGVADFDGDDKADILWRQSPSGAVGMWLMDGTSFRSAATVGNPSFDWMIAGVGDFDLDGKADVLWRSTTGLVGLWLMNGPFIVGAPIATENVEGEQRVLQPGLEWIIQ